MLKKDGKEKEKESEDKLKGNIIFNINEKKNPFLILTYHTDCVICLIMLKEGRMASGSHDGTIIIFNKYTYKPDLVITEHLFSVICLIELRSGILASCSPDQTIILYKIYKNSYSVLQTLSHHESFISKIIELKNEQLVSCSYDKSIIFYSKKDNKYIMDYKLETNDQCHSVIQSKNNEICYSCYSGYNGYDISFFDILQRKNKCTINNIRDSDLLMITEDLLLIGGFKISLINVHQYNLISIIRVPNRIYSICLLNKNTILNGDDSGFIRQWKLEGDNLILFSHKEKAHNSAIYSLLNLPNNHFVSGSKDKTIKIW